MRQLGPAVRFKRKYPNDDCDNPNRESTESTQPETHGHNAYFFGQPPLGLFIVAIFAKSFQSPSNLTRSGAGPDFFLGFLATGG
jgi:hypothetical protein